MTSYWLFYMVAASGGEGSSPPSLPLASHITSENLYQVPLGHDQWKFSFNRCPHGRAFWSLVKESSGLPPHSAACRAPAGRVLVDSRRRQRSIALNHIPPLPIPHGLRYQLGSRMYLVVVHPRLEATGLPFPRSPTSRSCVNLRVLWALTLGPQGRHSPLPTPHGRPGVQRIFPTSCGQGPHGWPRVPHSMATGFSLPRGCCPALSVVFSPLCFVCNSTVSLSPLPHPVTIPVPAPHPSSRVHTPPGCQQPRGAGSLDPHPSGDRFLRLARFAPIPSPCFSLFPPSPIPR